ncbi:MAG: hypothetical protein FWB91_01940, partial [Defluviitaleaceae bacterium]|nr:hypothetical protein [Defluviitaleaceae bacterium]
MIELLPMFPGAVNSPETFITADVSETDTIITVQSTTGFPETNEPYVLVLGGGFPNAETIRVIAVSGNTLTVERGYQGTAQAWPQGTTIACNFTEAHYRALVENTKSLSSALNHANSELDNMANELTAIQSVVAGQNILRNWDFRHIASIINQRGLMEYENLNWGAIYSIDRWAVACGTLTMQNGGIRLTRTSTIRPDTVFSQSIEFPDSYAGMTVTLSVKIPEGIFFNTHAIPLINGSNWSGGMTPLGNTSFVTYLWRNAAGVLTFNVGSIEGTPVGSFIDIEAVELVPGTVSTLANRVPMDFGRELLTCMRFYEKSYPYHIAPGAATVHTALTRSIVDRNGIFASGFMFQVPKRIPPRVTIHSFRTGNINEVEPAFITTPISVTAIEGVSS